jgi:V8-like Glu-specific endopeptidase
MPNKPLSRDEVQRQHAPRPALRETDLPISFRQPPTPPRPGARVFPPPVEGAVLERPDRAAVSEVLRGARRRFHAPLEDLSADQLMELSREIAERLAAVRRIQAKGTKGLLPDHLPFKPVLPELDEHRRVRPFIGARVGLHLGHLQPGEFQATTIFPPDQRYLFDDTSFPWCTTGRVDVSGGWGSGVLVGPRHLLCASHMMTWNPNNTVNQVTFTPSYFDSNAPFGNAGIIHWYAYRKVVGPTLSVADTEEDYVCLVLDQRLGDLCGWMGTQGYDSSWDGLTDWDHIGYPGDLGGGSRPSFQGSISIDSVIGGSSDEYLAQKADVWPGQSGGPFFDWFGSNPWPSVVGIQSAQNSSTNSAGGGNYIPNMVSQALADFP